MGSSSAGAGYIYQAESSLSLIHSSHLFISTTYSLDLPPPINTMSRPTLKAFTPLAAAAIATVPVERAIQGTRSYSFSSSTSSTSSTYSRAPEDLVDRLACHQVCPEPSPKGCANSLGLHHLPTLVRWQCQDPEARPYHPRCRCCRAGRCSTGGQSSESPPLSLRL